MVHPQWVCSPGGDGDEHCQSPASPADLDRRRPGGPGHRCRHPAQRVCGCPGEPPARRRRRRRRGPRHDPAGGLAPPGTGGRGRCPGGRGLLNGLASAPWSAVVPPCRPSSWWPSRSGPCATGPGRRWGRSRPAATTRRAFTIPSRRAGGCRRAAHPRWVFAAGRLVRTRTGDGRRAAGVLGGTSPRRSRRRAWRAGRRARVSADLEASLHAELGGIAAAAAEGLATSTPTRRARRVLTSIEQTAGPCSATCARSSAACTSRPVRRSRRWPGCLGCSPGRPVPMPA